MIYVYLVDPTSIYRYLIYLGGYVVLLFIDTAILYAPQIDRKKQSGRWGA